MLLGAIEAKGKFWFQEFDLRRSRNKKGINLVWMINQDPDIQWQ